MIFTKVFKNFIQNKNSFLAEAREKKQHMREVLSKTLVNSVNRKKCKVPVNDVIKQLAKDEIAVKLERIKLKPWMHSKKKVTLVKKLSLKSSLKRLKRQQQKKEGQIEEEVRMSQMFNKNLELVFVQS